MSTTNEPPPQMWTTAGISVTWSNNALYVLQPDLSGGRYDPCRDEWTPIAPAPATLYRILDTDSGVFLTGLPPAGGFVFFDYASLSWRALSGSGYPTAADAGGAAVWTGRVLVRWGGIAQRSSPYDVLTNTGAIYDPAADRWKPMSTAGAPAARDLDPTLTGGLLQVPANDIVAGGERVFVWGGAIRNVQSISVTADDPTAAALTATPGLVCPDWNPIYCAFGDGAVYDPAANRWTPMSMTGAPSARVDHLMFWTGSRLLIWGGAAYALDASGFPAHKDLTDGAFYDPATDQWTPTAPMPVPTRYPRSSWSRGRIVVTPDQTMPEVMFIYDPARDQWQPAMPAPSVPASYITLLDSASNSWLVFPPRPLEPDERFEVFTGKLMIAWGGIVPGPTPPNPCLTNPYPGCDPPGPQWFPTNEGDVAAPLP
jgi:hypothetical protein